VLKAAIRANLLHISGLSLRSSRYNNRALERLCLQYIKNRDQQLRLFLEIAQRLSLSKAADVLGLTQSARSKQLASLEQFIGQPLFERTGRGVSPTDAGRKLQDVVHPAYELVDAVVRRLQEQQGDTDGTFELKPDRELSLSTEMPLLRAFFINEVGANKRHARTTRAVRLNF
jgi:hypothetical protein